MAVDVPRTVPGRTELCRLLGVSRSLDVVPEWSWSGDPAAGSDGVVVRRLQLAVPGDDPVPCLFLSPPGRGPWPGAVAIHQHNNEFSLGKSEPAGWAGDPQMSYGMALARRGVATLVPDLLGFEERRGRLPGPENERLHAFHLLVQSSCLQARHVEDVSSAVSWLGAQDDVSGPVGLIGHSLGGQVAFFAAACDARVRAAVISCGLGTVESFHRAGVLHNPAWYVPGLATAGDTPAVAAVAVGQTFWVTAGAEDPLFPMAGVREAVAGFPPGSAHLEVFGGGHAFPPDVASRAIDWLVGELAP